MSFKFYDFTPSTCPQNYLRIKKGSKQKYFLFVRDLPIPLLSPPLLEPEEGESLLWLL